MSDVTLPVLRLEQMTLFDLPPADVVSLAADLGQPYVGLWVTPGLPGTVSVDATNLAEVRARLDATGVRVDTVELFDLRPAPRDVAGSLELAAALGARTIVAIHADGTEPGQAGERLAALGALAASYGLRVGIEPIAMGTTRTIAEGLALLEASGLPDAGLVVDLLHVVRTGGHPRDLDVIPAERIVSLQLCDGPADPGSFEEQIDEAMSNRGVPGTGDFPCSGLLARCPDGVAVGLEVPQRAAYDAGVGHRDRTRALIDAVTRLTAG